MPLSIVTRLSLHIIPCLGLLTNNFLHLSLVSALTLFNSFATNASYSLTHATFFSAQFSSSVLAPTSLPLLSTIATPPRNCASLVCLTCNNDFGIEHELFESRALVESLLKRIYLFLSLCHLQLLCGVFRPRRQGGACRLVSHY